MSQEEARKQVLAAITSGKLQPTNIIFGDYVEHKIENVEAGGIGFQINHGGSDNEESIYPVKGNYAGVLAWLARQKEKEHIDYYVASGQNRSKMCRKLSEIFGWEVSENSLRKAEEAQKMKKKSPTV